MTYRERQSEQKGQLVGRQFIEKLRNVIESCWPQLH